MNLLTQYLKPYIGRISLGVSIKFFGSLMDLLLPWILAYIIDSVIPTKQVSAIFAWGGAMVVCSIIAVVTNIIANRMASSVARDTTGSIRHDLFEKVSYLSIPQVEEVGIPSLVSRLTTDTYNIHQTVGMIQRMGIRAPILLLGGDHDHCHIRSRVDAGLSRRLALHFSGGSHDLETGDPLVCFITKASGCVGANCP